MKNKQEKNDVGESMMMGLVGAGLLLFLDLFTFSTLLDANSVMQKIFYGPLLLLGNLLEYGEREWGWPIPLTMFGGFPVWIDWLLLFINWSAYAAIGFFIGKWVSRRKKARNEV